MINKIKIPLLLIFVLVLGLVYTTGCLPGGFDLFSTGDPVTPENMEISTGEGQEEDGLDLDSKLSGLKEGLVSAPVILSHVSGDQIFGSGEKEMIFVKGLADPGSTIEISVNGILVQDDLVADAKGSFETLNGIEIIEGKNVIELVAIESSGRKSNPTKFNLILVVPQKVEYAIYDNSTDLEPIEGSYYSTESQPTVYLRGTYIPGAVMYIQANDIVVGETTVSEEGMFSLGDIKLDTGDNEIAVWAVTNDGYISSPYFTSIAVFRDLITPFPSNLTGYHNADANYIEWGASIDDNFESYKIVRVEDPCINPEYPIDDVVATITDQNSTSFIDNELEDGRSYYYTVWTLDKAGHAVSSNVLALPKPVYTVSITKVDSFTDYSVSRREWFYQYYEITNTGNVTLDLQPIMAWIKLDPEPDEEMEITPLWEVHIWNPDNPGIYYYSDELIKQSYISDWVNSEGYTVIDTEEELDYLNGTKTVTVTEVSRRTESNEVNLKRIMTVYTETTVTEYDITTDPATEISETVTFDTTTEIVEPEKIGSLIEDLRPGEKIKIGVKIQNVSAANNEEITVHFNFAPVDCDGHFFIDEIISTGEIFCKSSGRNP